jgi:hypothetical protein
MSTPTQTQLETGLGGVVGCDYLASESKLFFVTFDNGNFSSVTVPPAPVVLDVLGTGYNNPEDVKLSADGVHAYITERSGDLVRLALKTPDRSAATVVTSGMTAPQQMFLDEAHDSAYVVEFSASGRLLKVNLTNGAKTVIASGLNNPVGVVLSSSRQYAYVTEQTSGPDKGRVSRVQVSNGLRTTIAKGLTNPFFLTWTGPSEDALYVPQRDPINSILIVNVTNGATNTAVSGVPFRPSSVAVANSTEMLICSDSVIEEVIFAPFLADGPLLMGIGNIPADEISTTTGLATTPATSLCPVTDAPFGGTLPIMVNYQSADSAGAAFYQVLVDGAVQTAAWTVFHWNGTANVQITVTPETVTPGGTTGCYPVHPVAQLFAFQPPALGYLLDSTALSNGLHKIQLQFVDSSGNKMPGVVSLPTEIMVNNQSCVAVISPPTINTTPAQTASAQCGTVNYGSNKSLTVSVPYTATQPAKFGRFSFSITRGTSQTFAGPQNAPVPATAPFTDSVATLLGTCSTAGFAAVLYVAATMTNGIDRQGQYDAEAQAGIALTP